MAFPTIPTSGAGTIVSQLNTAGGATKTFTNILNGLTKSSGDLLLAICVIYDGNSTNAEFSSWTAGWTEFGDIATTTTMGIGAAYKFSNGAESGNLAVTTADTSANDSAMIVMAIPGAHATSPPEIGGTSSGTTSTATPNSISPSWGAEDTLWIPICGCGEDATTGSFTGITNIPPTNYSNQLNTGISADVVGGIEAAVAFRQLNAASEDPGNFGNDTSNARWRCALIAVRPSSAVTTPQALTATATSTATIQKQANKALSATATTTATMVKQVNKPLSATATTTATLAALKVIIKAITATATTTATLRVRVSKLLTATSTTSASVQKQANKVLTATATSTATLQALRVIVKAITATATTTTTVRVQVNKTVSATTTSSATAVKAVQKLVTATATTLASIVTDVLLVGGEPIFRFFRNRPRPGTGYGSPGPGTGHGSPEGQFYDDTEPGDH